jgi:hypothetical protein
MDFTANVAASGAISNVASNFTNGGFWMDCGIIFAHLVLDGSTTGTVDPGAQTIAFPVDGDEEGGLRAKVQFAGVTAGFCETDVFPMDASGLINDPDGCGGNDLGETEFCIEADDFGMPEVHAQPNLSCPGAVCINTLFGLPALDGGYLYLHGATTDAIEEPE